MTWFTGVAGWGGARCDCLERLYDDPLAAFTSVPSPPALNAEGTHVARWAGSSSVIVYVWPDGNTPAAFVAGIGERGEEAICMGHDGELFGWGTGTPAPRIDRFDDVIGGGGSSTLVAGSAFTNFPACGMAYGLYDDQLYCATSGYKVGASAGSALFRVHPVTGVRTVLYIFTMPGGFDLQIGQMRPVCTLDGGVWKLAWDIPGYISYFLMRWDIPTATAQFFPFTASTLTASPSTFAVLHHPADPTKVVLTDGDGNAFEVWPNGIIVPFDCPPFPASVGGQRQLASGIDETGNIVLTATDANSFPDGPGGFYGWCPVP